MQQQQQCMRTRVLSTCLLLLMMMMTLHLQETAQLATSQAIARPTAWKHSCS
jgi:hypothetical protein